MIVDASVAAMWILAEPESEAACRLISPKHALTAPDILIAEVLGALHKASKVGRFDPALCATALETVQLAIDSIVPTSVLALTAFDLASRLDHHVIDCLYLAAAIETKDTLVTADHDFLNKVRLSPWRAHATELNAVQP